MASRAPDPANTETDRQRQAEAAALALLLAGSKQRYSLPQLIALNRIKPRQFRRIAPTNALKADLSAPYFAIVRAWGEQVPGIVSGYTAGAPDFAQSAVARAAAAIDPIITAAQGQFSRVVENVERWHRGQWLSRTKAATGLDVGMFTAASDVSQAAEATVAWNKRLAADVSQEIERRAANEIAAAAAADLPAEQVLAKIMEAVAKAKRRAAAIGDDQVDKLSRAMDRQRREAAGVTSFLWLHTPQPHPRPHHEARNGKVFTAGDIPADDRAGVPPFCKCYELPLLQ